MNGRRTWLPWTQGPGPGPHRHGPTRLCAEAPAFQKPATEGPDVHLSSEICAPGQRVCPRKQRVRHPTNNRGQMDGGKGCLLTVNFPWLTAGSLPHKVPVFSCRSANSLPSPPVGSEQLVPTVQGPRATEVEGLTHRDAGPARSHHPRMKSEAARGSAKRWVHTQAGLNPTLSLISALILSNLFNLLKHKHVVHTTGRSLCARASLPRAAIPSPTDGARKQGLTLSGSWRLQSGLQESGRPPSL